MIAIRLHNIRAGFLTNVVVSSESNTRLVISGNHALQGIHSKAMMRYILPVIGATLFSYKGFLIGLLLAYLLHQSIKSYTGFGFNIQSLPNADCFVPLKRVLHGKRELSGTEYQEVMNSFTDETNERLNLIMKIKGQLTVLDAINLTMFDSQVGIPNQIRHEQERLKNDIKRQFNQ